MKKIKWNIGWLIIYLGYKIRKYQLESGKITLTIGYWIRGEVPQKHWGIVCILENKL